MTELARNNGPARVTIREVADAAGVSIATVSRVLNGHGDVSPETRVRKRVNDFASAHAQYHQPFCQFRWSHKSNCQLTIVNFQLSIPYE